MKLKQTLLAGSLSLAMILSLSTVASASNKVNFEQNTATDNTYGYVDSEVDRHMSKAKAWIQSSISLLVVIHLSLYSMEMEKVA